jgi:hypothetical protein
MQRPSSPDPTARSSPWIILAGAILAFEGLSVLVYAGFLRAPFDGMTVTLPFLGQAAVLWLALGVLDLVAAAGVYRRRAWGRALGIASALLSIGTNALLIGSVDLALVPGLVLPVAVLFALGRRWPAPMDR